MPYDIVIREGDNFPALRRTLNNGEGPFNLTNTVVKLVITDAATGIQISDEECVVASPASSGVVEYGWPAPVPPIGTYFAYFDLLVDGTGHVTVPNDSTLSLLVTSTTQHGYSVTGRRVADFLGRGSDNDFATLAQIHADIVTDLARAYTRGRGFKNNQPNQEIASVIIMATARVSVNPEQVKREQSGEGYIVTPGTLYGWTLTELAVLNRYRTRAK